MIYHGRMGFTDLADEVRVAVANLKPHKAAFDLIAVRGVSGMSVGFPVSLRLNRPIVVSRVAGQSGHSSGEAVCGDMVIVPDLRVLFLDDFISSGQTYRIVKAQMEKRRAVVVATYEYRSHKLTWRNHES